MDTHAALRKAIKQAVRRGTLIQDVRWQLHDIERKPLHQRESFFRSVNRCTYKFNLTISTTPFNRIEQFTPHGPRQIVVSMHKKTVDSGHTKINERLRKSIESSPDARSILRAQVSKLGDDLEAVITLQGQSKNALGVSIGRCGVENVNAVICSQT